MTLAAVLITFGALGAASVARADTILYIDDTSGNIGQVDITTQSVVSGSVHSTGLGSNLTDLGFTSSGTLYGTTFTGLYSINPATGSATNVTTYSGGINTMNALVGNGSSLLGASNSTKDIYAIDPASGSVSLSAHSTEESAGDLAFANSILYEAGIGKNGNDSLVNITSGKTVGAFKVGNGHGSELSGVFGLADDGTNMYAVDGTTVYTVNLKNAVLTKVFNYGGHGLGSADGTAFIGEGPTDVPEPGSLMLLGTGLVMLGVFLKRRRI